jgi:Tfp pilus assembly protein PilF
MTAPKTRQQQIEEMLAEDPNDPFLRYGLAMEYIAQGDHEAAARCFHELIEVAPDYVPAYMQWGQVLVRLGRTNEAGEVWSRGVAVAQKAGDQHASEEMQGFIANLK